MTHREIRRMNRDCVVCNETDAAVMDEPLVQDDHSLKGEETWVCERCGYSVEEMPVEFADE